MEAFSLKSVYLLKSEDIELFLQNARTHPVLSKRLGNIDSSRMSELAQRIRILLNSSFKYDRVSLFRKVLKIHKIKSITQEEVFAFRDLLLKECCPADFKPLSVKKKINRPYLDFDIAGEPEKDVYKQRVYSSTGRSEPTQSCDIGLTLFTASVSPSN